MTLSLWQRVSWPKHLHHLPINEIGHLTMHHLPNCHHLHPHHRHLVNIFILILTMFTIANLIITIMIATCSTVGGDSHQMWEGGQRCRQAQSCQSEESALEKVNRKGWKRGTRIIKFQLEPLVEATYIVLNPLSFSHLNWDIFEDNHSSRGTPLVARLWRLQFYFF